jgi:hypothetical protein
MLENKLLKNDPVVIALEAEVSALKSENERLKYIIEELKVPRGLRTVYDETDYMSLKDIPEKLVLPLALESSLKRDNTLDWQMLVRASKTWGDFRYGFYVSEPELLGCGDILSVAANLIERSMFDLADFYRRK